MSPHRIAAPPIRLLWRAVAWCILSLSLATTLAIARLLRGRRSHASASGPILVTGTFYNHGWFMSHVEPLARSSAHGVVVITDVAQAAPERVMVLWPSRWLVHTLGRAGAKLFLMWRAGRMCQPCLYMGYHLFPGALSALLVARLRGRPAAYQMTGGPIELLGGGYSNENLVMSRLGGPSRLLELLALAVVREFDLIVVRGRQAQRFLAEHGIDAKVTIITGSVQPSHGDVLAGRSIDLIFVGRLAPIKQPQQFVDIVGRLVKSHPYLRTVVIGSGPELDLLRRQAQHLGILDHIDFLGQRDDVFHFLRLSKVFVLTSRTEGMSIALVEAMACGVPPVAADVGELSDVVRSGLNGWLVRQNDLEEYVRRITDLLDDPVTWATFSTAARDVATSLASVENVTRRWRACLEPVVDVRQHAVL